MPSAQRGFGQFLELRRGPPTRDRQVRCGRAQVLAERHDLDSHSPQVAERRNHLGHGLAHAEDDARFRRAPGRGRTGEHGKAPRVGGRRAHGALEAVDGLEIVVQDVGAGLEDDAERGFVALAVRDENLDSGSGLRRRMAAMVPAKAFAPPSARSSRATAVTTACVSRIRATASATRSGSPGSSGSGRLVSTGRNHTLSCSAHR